MPHPSPPRPLPGASPLWPVLALTGLSSFAAGTSTLSIFFVTLRAPYAFSAVQQYALGLTVGVSYTLGALSAGAVRRALERRGLSARLLLALLTLALAALACVPLVAESDAAIFVLLALYSPLTGIFWPLVEGYVSGGRSGARLRSAIGRFNIVWSVTLLPSFLCILPLLERSSSAVFAAVALTHLAAVACVARLAREPGAHDAHGEIGADHAQELARARELLRVHRVLHALSYLVMYALSPTLPILFARLELTGTRASLLAATWLATRVAGFVVLERWHGWHGRWSMATLGSALVLCGFGATVLAPGIGPGALAPMVLGLSAFGLGLAALYTAALYYAFQVGGSEGGGSHEALIGLGYSIGPSCGLLVCALESGGLVAGVQRDGALLAVISVVCLGGAGLAWRHRRAPSSAA